VKLLKVPDSDEIGNSQTPNRKFPSDHFPIMGVFEFKESKKEED